MTVLSNPGSIGLSIAGEEDQFKIAANVIMMAERLTGKEMGEDAVVGALKGQGINPTPENIERVKSHFSPRAWKNKLVEPSFKPEPVPV